MQLPQWIGRTGIFACLAPLLVGGWGVGPSGQAQAAPGEVVVYTSVDQVFSEPLFRAFERKSGVRVRAVFDTEETKSTGVLNRLIAEGSHPQADVFLSGDPVRPYLLIHRGLVSPYRSPAAAGIPKAFQAPDGGWTGFAARARVLLVNTRLVPASKRPKSVMDLADPAWKGRTAIANPLYGTTTMHVAALFDAWGDTRAKAFLDRLKASKVRLASSNGEVKRLVASGEVAFGLADTDDGHEALSEGAPIAVVFPDQRGSGTLLMPTAAVLIRGGPHPAIGRRLIDYLVAPDVEQVLAQSAGHLPLRPGIPAPNGYPDVSHLKVMKVNFGRLGTVMERIQPLLRSWVGL